MPESQPTIEEPLDFPIEFDGESFTINYLSLSPNGFSLKTRNSLPRHHKDNPQNVKRIKAQRERDPKDYSVGEKFHPLVAIRNMSREENQLEFDIMPVTHATYRAISSPQETRANLEISQPIGVAIAFLTTEEDGSHKLVIQHRDPENFFYGDVLGASAAGFLDGELEKERAKRGLLVPIDTDNVKENALREAEEELGIEKDDVEELKVIGIAQDKIRVHNEFLLMGVLKLSTSELASHAEKAALSKNPEDKYDFSEEFFTTNATPEAIMTLLTKVKCPVAATHGAVFVAAGYTMMIEKEGIKKANEWKNEVEKGSRQNVEDMNRMIEEFYKKNPHLLKDQPEGKPPRNPHGYEPAYKPEEQGLPRPTTALEVEKLI